MNRSVPNHIFILLMIFSPIVLKAQCPGSLVCEKAVVVCSMDELHGLKCNNPNIPNVTFPVPFLCFGVGVPHNLAWWGFAGNGSPTTLTFEIDPATCEMGTGIQVGVFEGSCDGSTVWDCNPSCNTGPFSLTGFTKSCTPYYLWVDGCNGDVCTFEVIVNTSGDDPTLPDIPELTTTDPICPCGEFEVCLPPLGNCLPTTEWTVNGDTIAGDRCVRIPVDEMARPGGNMNVCVVATLGDPKNPNAICDQKTRCTSFVVMDSIPKVEGECVLRCSEDQPVIWHGLNITTSCISPPCSVRVQTPDGCCVDSFKSFILIPPSIAGIRDTFICEKGVPFVVENGRVYINEACGESIDWRIEKQNSNCPDVRRNCDTSYSLNLGRFDYSSDWKFDCDSCSGTLKLCPNIFYDGCSFFDSSVTIELLWLESISGDTIGITSGDSCLVISRPGQYCLEVTGKYKNQICQTLVPECITVDEAMLLFDLELSGTNRTCKHITGVYSAATKEPNCSYEWRIPSGNGIILTQNSLDSSSIRVDWSNATDSVGVVCVTVTSDCGRKDTCMQIYLDTVEILRKSQNLICPDTT